MFNDKNSYNELITIDEIKHIYGNMALHTVRKAVELYNSLEGEHITKLGAIFEMGRIQGKREERANKRITPPENGQN